MKYVVDGYVQSGYVKALPYVTNGYVVSGYVDSPNENVNILPSPLHVTITPYFILQSITILAESINISVNIQSPLITIGGTVVNADYTALLINVKSPNITIGNTIIEADVAYLLVDIKSPYITTIGNNYVTNGYVVSGYVKDIIEVFSETISLSITPYEAEFRTNRAYPNSASMAITINDVSISLSKTVYPNSTPLNIAIEPPEIVILDFPINPQNILLSISVNAASFLKTSVVYIGGSEEENIDNGSIVISPSPLWLKIRPYYESQSKNAFIRAQKQSMNMALYSPHVNMVINTKTIHIGIKINSSMAQMDERRLVVKIDNVELDYPMYFDDTEEITHTATKTKAVDDSTVVSILPLGKYSKSVTISGYTFDFDAIRSISFDKEVELVFKDNSTEMARFDLLNNPLSIDEVANNYYDVKMKVLI